MERCSTTSGGARPLANARTSQSADSDCFGGPRITRRAQSNRWVLRAHQPNVHALCLTHPPQIINRLSLRMKRTLSCSCRSRREPTSISVPALNIIHSLPCVAHHQHEIRFSCFSRQSCVCVRAIIEFTGHRGMDSSCVFMRK